MHAVSDVLLRGSAAMTAGFRLDMTNGSCDPGSSRLLHHTGLHLNVLLYSQHVIPSATYTHRERRQGSAVRCQKNQGAALSQCFGFSNDEKKSKNPNKRGRGGSTYRFPSPGCQLLQAKCTAASLSKVLVASELIRVQHCARTQR